MADRAINLELCRDLGFTQAADAGHAWVLPTMSHHGPGLLRLLWRILGNEQDVCDAYQDTFLRLAHAPHRPQSHALRGYLYRTATNVAISMIRRRKARQKTCRELAATPNAPAAPSVDYAADLDSSDLRLAMRTNIARLPEHLRTVVVLRDLGELPYQQVAEIMNISPATARVYRCRAIKILAHWMTDKQG